MTFHATAAAEPSLVQTGDSARLFVLLAVTCPLPPRLTTRKQTFVAKVLYGGVGYRSPSGVVGRDWLEIV